MEHQPVVMYCTAACPFCVAARHLLRAKGVSWTEVPIDQQSEKRAEMMQRSGRHTVPQVFIGERHVGGFDELNQLEQRGELDRWLATSGE